MFVVVLILVNACFGFGFSVLWFGLRVFVCLFFGCCLRFVVSLILGLIWCVFMLDCCGFSTCYLFVFCTGVCICVWFKFVLCLIFGLLTLSFWLVC